MRFRIIMTISQISLYKKSPSSTLFSKTLGTRNSLSHVKQPRNETSITFRHLVISQWNEIEVSFRDDGTFQLVSTKTQTKNINKKHQQKTKKQTYYTNNIKR